MAFRTERLAEGVTCILGDCREVIPMPGSNPDAVVTDPPFGMNYNTDNARFGGRGRSDRTIVGDDKPFDPQPWLAFDAGLGRVCDFSLTSEPL